MVKRRSLPDSSSEDENENVDETKEVDDEEVTEEIHDEEPNRSTENKSNSTHKIFIAHKSIEEAGWDHTIAISLTHPRTKAEALFLVVDVKEDEPDELKTKRQFVYEILTMKEPLRSWFVDETVVSNGNLYTFTPLDPLFLLLPVLSKTTKAMPFSDHLTDVFPSNVAKIFFNRLSPKQLENIAIKKVCGDIEAYAYSEEAALNWLSKKAKNASQFLSQKGINGSEVSISVNFTKSLSSATTTGEVKEPDEIKFEYLQYGCDIVGDYIDDSLKKKLLTKLGLPTEPERSKRKNDEDGIEGSKKKLKGNDNAQPLEDYGSNSSNSPAAAKASGKGTAKEKELQKAAQGTRSLLSFFTPKTKKT